MTLKCRAVSKKKIHEDHLKDRIEAAKEKKRRQTKPMNKCNQSFDTQDFSCVCFLTLVKLQMKSTGMVPGNTQRFYFNFATKQRKYIIC